MALGSRPSTARSRAFRQQVAVTTAGVPPTPVSIIDPEVMVERRYESIPAQMAPAPIFFGLDCPIATLAAPAPDQIFVVERMLVTNFPLATQIAVCGGAPITDDLRDVVSSPTSHVLVTADPQPIVLLPLQPLHVIWLGPTSADGYQVNLQLRVEEA